MIQIRELKAPEINRALFFAFMRHQVVEKCLKKTTNGWEVVSNPFVDDWNEDDYKVLIHCLKNTIYTNGVVYGAFYNGKLKGFCSVESTFFGKNKEYLDLTSLHVSEDLRKMGIGRELFLQAAEWAKNRGAKKLYISSHSAQETQAFYLAMGATDAAEYNFDHVREEPWDRQLEYCCKRSCE